MIGESEQVLAKVGMHRTQRKLCCNLRQGRIDTGTYIVQREVETREIQALTQKRNRQNAICVLIMQCMCPHTAICGTHHDWGERRRHTTHFVRHHRDVLANCQLQNLPQSARPFEGGTVFFLFHSLPSHTSLPCSILVALLFCTSNESLGSK